MARRGMAKVQQVSYRTVALLDLVGIEKDWGWMGGGGCAWGRGWVTEVPWGGWGIVG